MTNRSFLKIRRARLLRALVLRSELSTWRHWSRSSLMSHRRRASLSLTVQQPSGVEEQTPEEVHRWVFQQGNGWHNLATKH